MRVKRDFADPVLVTMPTVSWPVGGAKGRNMHDDVLLVSTLLMLIYGSSAAAAYHFYWPFGTKGYHPTRVFNRATQILIEDFQARYPDGHLMRDGVVSELFPGRDRFWLKENTTMGALFCFASITGYSSDKELLDILLKKIPGMNRFVVPPPMGETTGPGANIPSNMSESTDTRP